MHLRRVIGRRSEARGVSQGFGVATSDTPTDVVANVLWGKDNLGIIRSSLTTPLGGGFIHLLDFGRIILPFPIDYASH